MRSIILLLLISLIITCTVYGKNGGDVNLISQFPDRQGVNTDLLEIYMAMIFRDPEVLFPEWQESYWEKYHYIRSQWVYEILTIYEYGTRNDMVSWFLQYEIALSRFLRPNDLTIVRSLPATGHIFSLPVLEGHYFTYMPIRRITSTTSHQWRFKPNYTVDDYGFVRYQTAYAIALGTYYGITIGGIYEIEFANGEVIYAVLGDVKRDSETDPTNRFHPTPGSVGYRTGNVVEFIIDDESRWSHLSVEDRVAPINAMIRARFPSDVIRIQFVGVSNHAIIR